VNEAGINQRYFRKTQAHPDGSVVHHGDCDFFSIWICTCGLLHDLVALNEEITEKLYPSFWKEQGLYDQARTEIMTKPKRKKA